MLPTCSKTCYLNIYAFLGYFFRSGSRTNIRIPHSGCGFGKNRIKFLDLPLFSRVLAYQYQYCVNQYRYSVPVFKHIKFLLTQINHSCSVISYDNFRCLLSTSKVNRCPQSYILSTANIWMRIQIKKLDPAHKVLLTRIHCCMQRRSNLDPALGHAAGSGEAFFIQI